MTAPEIVDRFVVNYHRQSRWLWKPLKGAFRFKLELESTGGVCSKSIYGHSPYSLPVFKLVDPHHRWGLAFVVK